MFVSVKAFIFAVKYLLLKQIPLFIYSVRDGYLKYYFKAYIDVIRNLKKVLQGRNVLKRATLRYMNEINSNKAGLVRLINNRLFQRGIKI